MELLESNNPKSELMQKSIRQRKVLEDEVHQLSERTEKIIVNALIVGSALALTYWIVRGFTSDSRSRQKEHKQSDEGEIVFIKKDGKESKIAAVLSEVGSLLATQATAFLLALAKEKLMEYLAATSTKEEKGK
ncbi:MAG TPA: hypothetical protein VFW11_02015 [Cyclobacteriaceae bacterium]|nr:hypothetical protein [Cyclobacteriaceae bacterium]